MRYLAILMALAVMLASSCAYKTYTTEGKTKIMCADRCRQAKKLVIGQTLIVQNESTMSIWGLFGDDEAIRVGRLPHTCVRPFVIYKAKMYEWVPTGWHYGFYDLVLRAQWDGARWKLPWLYLAWTPRICPGGNKQ